MITFKEIRHRNKRKDMLFSGMEQKSIQLSPEVIKEMKDFYRECIKPTRERVFARQIEKGNL